MEFTYCLGEARFYRQEGKKTLSIAIYTVVIQQNSVLSIQGKRDRRTEKRRLTAVEPERARKRQKEIEKARKCKREQEGVIKSKKEQERDRKRQKQTKNDRKSDGKTTVERQKDRERHIECGICISVSDAPHSAMRHRAM